MLRYMTAALLLRVVDAGATVGLVLLCTARSDVGDPIRTAGLLGAALTAPHLAGPFVSRWVDRSRDPRLVIASAGIAYAVLLAAAVSLLGHLPLGLIGLLVAGAGLCGPILTGGLSSLLPDLRLSTTARRRSSVDGLTYGLAASTGPALVSVLGPWLSPATALLVLLGCAVAGSAVTTRLPLGTSARDGVSRPAPGGTLAQLWRQRPMRRVTMLTWTGAGVVSAVMLMGVARGQELAPGRGGWVAAAFGLGSLLSGLVLALAPPARAADRGMATTAVALVPVVVAGALVPGWTGLVVIFALIGAADARMTAYSLAGRSEYSNRSDRGGVFMTVAGVKVAFASGGTALAGLLAVVGPPVVMLSGAAVLLGCAGWACLEVLRSRARPPRLGTRCPSRPMTRSSAP